MSVASGQVLESWRKMSILSCKKAEDRFVLYLRWYASEGGESDVRLPFKTSEDCARYLGISRTALSLAIKHLVKRGLSSRPSESSGRFARYTKARRLAERLRRLFRGRSVWA